MKVATWNVSSIRSRVERVVGWTARERPDVLCLQEIKTTEDLFPLAPFAELGYRAELFGQRTYNGVAILSLEPLQDVVRNLPDDEPDAPRRLIAATAGGVRVINVYVPNGQSPESEKFVYKLDWLARLGLRIDLILGTKPALQRCTACTIHRDERKGESPSDHVPVVAVLD